MNATPFSKIASQLAFCAVGAIAISSPVMAQGKKAAVDEQYRADVALCNSGKSPQSKQTCLYEAQSARQERAANRLTRPNQDYQANALERCRALPAGDQAACVQTMAGSSTKSYGSVSGGGVLRETTITVPANQVPPPPPAAGGYAPAGGGYQPAPAPAPMPVPGTGIRY